MSRLGDIVIGISTVVLDAFAALCVQVGLLLRDSAAADGGPPPPDWTPGAYWVLTVAAALVALVFIRCRMPVSATLQWLAVFALMVVALSAGTAPGH
jgi:hypothetical protein